MGAMFEKLVLVDCNGHLLGRLAATVAKQLLSGQKIVLVRAEKISTSGAFGRNCAKFNDFLGKCTIVTPRKVHFIFVLLRVSYGGQSAVWFPTNLLEEQLPWLVLKFTKESRILMTK